MEGSVVDVARIAAEFDAAIMDRNMPVFRELCGKLKTEEQRRAVVQIKRRMTLLCRAVWSNPNEELSQQFEIIKYLVEDCGADVEPPPSEDFIVMTALSWTLCCPNPNIEVVRYLVEHGANVNTAVQDKITPLLHACHSICKVGEPIIIRYLVENGANINATDAYGETCVMHCVGFPIPAACQYLLDIGGSVNAVDKLGNSALHCAVKHSYDPAVVEVLLQYGADPSARNQAGDDALQTTALYGTPRILDFLLGELKPSKQRCADLHSLMASQNIDKMFPDIPRAMLCLEKSVLSIDEATVGVVWKNPDPVFQGFEEVHDEETLEAVRNDENARFIQALVSRERILGRSHRETVHMLSKRALHYVRAGQYHRGIELYKVAAASLEACPRMYMDADLHRKFYTMMWMRYCHDASSVTFDEAFQMLTTLTQFVKCCASLSSSDERKKIDLVFEFIAYVVDLLSRLKSSEAESEALQKSVVALERAIYEHHRNYVVLYADRSIYLLHLAIAADARMLSSLFCERFPELVFPTMPNCGLLEELLNAGVAVNSRDDAGNTPLHLLARRTPKTADRGEWLLMIDQLLRSGAHIDIRNKKGETPGDKLPAISRNQHTRLECLAASAVRRHGVAYKNVVSAKQAAFVDLH